MTVQLKFKTLDNSLYFNTISVLKILMPNFSIALVLMRLCNYLGGANLIKFIAVVGFIFKVTFGFYGLIDVFILKSCHPFGVSWSHDNIPFYNVTLSGFVDRSMFLFLNNSPLSGFFRMRNSTFLCHKFCLFLLFKILNHPVNFVKIDD